MIRLKKPTKKKSFWKLLKILKVNSKKNIKVEKSSYILKMSLINKNFYQPPSNQLFLNNLHIQNFNIVLDFFQTILNMRN